MEEKRRKFIKLAMAGAGISVLGAFAYANRNALDLLDRQSLGYTVGNYDELPDDPNKHWGFIIDTGKCDGCENLEAPEDNHGEKQRCTYACRTSHFYQYADPPQYWIRVYELGDETTTGRFFFPKPCQNCQDAPCKRVCPTGATFQRKDGTVLINHDICIGCRICMAACPYETRFFWFKDPSKDNELVPKSVDYSPEYPVPHTRGTVIKCDLCVHNAYNNQLPHCVTACPQGALYFGDLNEDAVSNGEEVIPVKETLERYGGYRYKEEEGTQTSVFYLPPRPDADVAPLNIDTQIERRRDGSTYLKIDVTDKFGEPVKYQNISISRKTAFGMVEVTNGPTNISGEFVEKVNLMGSNEIEIKIQSSAQYSTQKVIKNVD